MEFWPPYLAIDLAPFSLKKSVCGFSKIWPCLIGLEEITKDDEEAQGGLANIANDGPNPSTCLINHKRKILVC